jgi:hypothetical protein
LKEDPLALPKGQGRKPGAANWNFAECSLLLIAVGRVRPMLDQDEVWEPVVSTMQVLAAERHPLLLPKRQAGHYRAQWDKLTGAAVGLQVCIRSNDGFTKLGSDVSALAKSIHGDASCGLSATVITTGHGPKTTGGGVTARVSTGMPVAAAGALKSPPGASGTTPTVKRATALNAVL